jgi:hypothetical protein
MSPSEFAHYSTYKTIESYPFSSATPMTDVNHPLGPAHKLKTLPFVQWWPISLVQQVETRSQYEHVHLFTALFFRPWHHLVIGGELFASFTMR